MFKPLTMCLGVRPARLDSMQRHQEPRRSRQWNLHHLNTKSDPPLGLHLFYCLATPTPHNPVSGFGQVSEKTSPINYPSKIPYIWNVSILRPIYQMKIHPQTASKVCFACLQNCCLYRSSCITCLELSYYHKTLSSK